MKEIWKDVKGFEGLYQVSNIGRVRSLDRYVDHCRGGKHFRRGKILKLSITSSGYKMSIFGINGKTKGKYVHRLVAETFIPNPKNKPQVNHIDGNKLNNSIENLEWCTRSENMKHAYKHGLQKPISGADHYASKLTYEDMPKIIEMRKQGMTYDAIGNNFSVSKEAISSIINGRTWKHIPELRQGEMK